MEHTNIAVAGIVIRQDHEGRFCLNDLHRSSGGEKRHQPSNWLALNNTQDLAALIDERAGGEASILSRQGLGTFVARELVYAYAMWVSPKFNLQVIDVYDKLASSTAKQDAVTLPDFNDPVQAARAWADEVERVRKLSAIAIEQKKHLKTALPAMEFHKAVSASKDSLTVGQFAKLMGVGEVNFFRLLRSDKILITGGARHNLPFQSHLDLERFEVIERVIRDHGGRERLSCQSRITPKGQLWLQKKYFPQDAMPQVNQRQRRLSSLAVENPGYGESQQLARAGVAPQEHQQYELGFHAAITHADTPPLAHPDQDVEASRSYYHPRVR